MTNRIAHPWGKRTPSWASAGGSACGPGRAHVPSAPSVSWMRTSSAGRRRPLHAHGGARCCTALVVVDPMPRHLSHPRSVLPRRRRPWRAYPITRRTAAKWHGQCGSSRVTDRARHRVWAAAAGIFTPRSSQPVEAPCRHPPSPPGPPAAPPATIRRPAGCVGGCPAPVGPHPQPGERDGPMDARLPHPGTLRPADHQRPSAAEDRPGHPRGRRRPPRGGREDLTCATARRCPSFRSSPRSS